MLSPFGRYAPVLVRVLAVRLHSRLESCGLSIFLSAASPLILSPLSSPSHVLLHPFLVSSGAVARSMSIELGGLSLLIAVSCIISAAPGFVRGGGAKYVY